MGPEMEKGVVILREVEIVLGVAIVGRGLRMGRGLRPGECSMEVVLG